MIGNKVSRARLRDAPLPQGSVQHAQVTWQRLVDTAAECIRSPLAECGVGCLYAPRCVATLAGVRSARVRFASPQPGRGTWARTFRDWRTVILVGSFVAVLVFFLFHLVSDGDFSFLMVSLAFGERRGARRESAPERPVAEHGL